MDIDRAQKESKYRYLYLVIASALFQSFSSVFGKIAASNANVSLYNTYISPFYLFMLVSLGVQAVFWTLSLKHFKLSFIYPILSVSLIFNSIFAVLIFKETYDFSTIAGMLLIVTGVVMLLGQLGAEHE